MNSETVPRQTKSFFLPIRRSCIHTNTLHRCPPRSLRSFFLPHALSFPSKSCSRGWGIVYSGHLRHATGHDGSQVQFHVSSSPLMRFSVHGIQPTLGDPLPSPTLPTLHVAKETPPASEDATALRTCCRVACRACARGARIHCVSTRHPCCCHRPLRRPDCLDRVTVLTMVAKMGRSDMVCVQVKWFWLRSCSSSFGRNEAQAVGESLVS